MSDRFSVSITIGSSVDGPSETKIFPQDSPGRFWRKVYATKRDAFAEAADMGLARFSVDPAATPSEPGLRSTLVDGEIDAETLLAHGFELI